MYVFHNLWSKMTHAERTSALVVVRITQWKRRVRRLSIAPIVTGHNALEAFIQSAAIYSVVLVLLLMTYTLGANPEIFGMDFLTPVIVRIHRCRHLRTY